MVSACICTLLTGESCANPSAALVGVRHLHEEKGGDFSFVRILEIVQL